MNIDVMYIDVIHIDVLNIDVMNSIPPLFDKIYITEYYNFSCNSEGVSIQLFFGKKMLRPGLAVKAEDSDCEVPGSITFRC